MRLRSDLHYLTGVYALDAIDDAAERTRFEHHMRRCQQCATEVRGMSETATRLAFAASRLAPQQLRARVLTAVSHTRQLPPRVDDHRSSARPRPVPRPRLAWVAAAACLVVAIALAITLVNAERQLHRSSVAERRLERVRVREEKIAALLTAPDTRAITHRTATGLVTTVVFSLQRHTMLVSPTKLPPLPAGKIYQLWLIGPPQTRSAGLLPAGKYHGLAPVLVTGVVKGDIFGMTVKARRNKEADHDTAGAAGPDPLTAENLPGISGPTNPRCRVERMQRVITHQPARSGALMPDRHR